MQCLTGQSQSNSFYRFILRKLNRSGIPFLVGGACMLEHVAKIVRPTKDFDLHVKQEDVEGMFAIFNDAGYQTEITFSHWLGKIFRGDTFVDVIFSSGNGVCKVDDEWFEHAVKGKAWGVPVKFCAPEEAIWSKAFVMERERYDGADIAHLIFACAEQMDWTRLLRRFGPHWRVLFSHLILFEFIYPDKRGVVPGWLWQELWDRTQSERNESPPENPACQGTLLSRTQYLYDIEHWRYNDARLGPAGTMAPEEVARWTEPATENCE
ncbi:MAG: hypothetical protein ACREQ7_14665 [Candidatus Binatia bacterium]